MIGYIWYEGREEEKNFNTLLEMINVSEAREDDENFKNPVDLMFDELEQKDPNHFAVRQYKKYKLAAGDMELLSPCNSSSRLRRSYSGVIFSFLMAVPPETKML